MSNGPSLDQTLIAVARRSTPIQSTILSLLIVAVSGMVFAQEGTLRPPKEQRSSLKPVAPSSSRTSASNLKSGDGETYVALAQGLRSVFDGKEPSTLSELRALEQQQSRVASAIEQVTVNVQQGSAQGSGVIITGDGYVLTAAHVAGGANRDAYILLNDGTRVRAKTLGMNRTVDAGLLKIVEERETPWPHATLGRSSELKIGQWCIGSGHPGGWRPERGAVIRVGRVLSIVKKRGEEANTLFTDCALIGGDSGGPLFTLEGKLIGIHSRIGTDVADNMHVPIDVFASSWDRMALGEVWGVLPGYRPEIGVAGIGTGEEPIIDSVKPQGAADLAGILAGDKILSIDGRKITMFAELQLAVQASMPGDVIVLKVQRGSQILQIPVTVGVSEG
jgi:serine protease Do